jgi:putative cell wall-binding protein
MKKGFRCFLIYFILAIILISSITTYPIKQVKANPIPTPDKVVELIEKRTEYTRTWRNTDLTETIQIFPTPLFYKDLVTDEWTNINNNLISTVIDTEKASYQYQNTANSFNTLFKSESTEQLFKLKNENLYLGYTLDHANISTSDVTSQIITYPNVYSNIEFSIENVSYGVIQTFEILQAQSVSQLSMSVLTNAILSQNEAEVKAVDTADSRNSWSIGSLELVDAKGKRGVNTKLTFDSVTNKVILDLDQAFLNDSQTIYPVHLSFTISSDQLRNKSKDAYVSQEWTDRNFNSGTDLYSGTTEDGFSSRTYLQFGEGLPVIPGLMNHAVLYMYDYGEPLYGGYYDPVYIDRSTSIHQVASPWSNTNVTWNTQPEISQESVNETYYKHYTAGKNAWNVTGFVRDWYKNNQSYGLLIKGFDGSISNRNKFYSSRFGDASYSPRIEINYTPASSIRATLYAGGLDKNSQRNELEYYWSPVTGAIGYKVLIYNGQEYEEFDVGNVTNWSSLGKKLWPTNEQINNGEFRLKKDGTGVDFSDDPRPVYQNAGGKTNEIKYWFKLKAYNKDGEIESAPVAVIPVDTTAPTKPGAVVIENSLNTEFTITWTPSEDRNVKEYWVRIGSKPGYGDVFSGYTSTNRMVVNKILQTRTDYYVSVQAIDLQGNYSSDSGTLARAGIPYDARIVSYSIPNLFTNSEVEAKVTIVNEGEKSWDSTNYLKLSGSSDLIMDQKIFLNSAETVRSGESKTFVFKIKAGNQTGNYDLNWQMGEDTIGLFGDITSKQIEVQQLVIPTPPIWPNNSSIIPNSQTDSEVTLSWSHATDPIKVEYYQIYQDHHLVTTVPGNVNFYVVQGLSPSTTYRFSVEAGNAYNLFTTTGPVFNLTTPPIIKTSTRISGSDRYATATAISQQGWNFANTVIIARGDDFPDALAGAPLAYKLNAPILLTDKNSLSTPTRDEIRRLGARKAIILGGTGAVSDSVKKSLESLGVTVERISGANRFETAVKIAECLGGSPEKAIITYGYNFPDALSIASYAARNGYPILLSQSNTLPGDTISALNSIKSTLVIGGPVAISEGVMKQLPNPTRISGKNRFDTSAKIAQSLNMVNEKAFIATGYGFADGLTGSVVAAKFSAPLLLVEPTKLPTETLTVVQQLGYKQFTILGGVGAVREEVVNELKN